MRKARRRYSIAAVTAMLTVAWSASAAAQQPQPNQRSAMQARAIADSTFAAALAVNDLADEIRHGTLSPRTHNDPALRQAVEQLSDAGAKRKKPKFLDKVPLWDFVFDSLSFEAIGQQELMVTARARFARDSSTSRRVTLHVRRNGTEWKVVGYGRLREYLDETREKAKGGPLK